MNRYTLTDPTTGTRWNRISKQAARRAWMERRPLIACPCKLHPFGYWRPSLVVDADEMNARDADARLYGNRYGTGFDMFDANACAYNCNYECGYYLAWYTTD